jgi:GTP cyclohydrolase II
MFTYLDPTVKQRLLAEGKLAKIDADGRILAAGHEPPAGQRALSILGPISLPLELEGRRYRVDWYASVRHTELS